MLCRRRALRMYSLRHNRRYRSCPRHAAGYLPPVIPRKAPPMLTLLGIPGALRAASTNRLLLAEARRAFGEAGYEEADLRLNRLGLLATLHQAMNRVADLSRLAA